MTTLRSTTKPTTRATAKATGSTTTSTSTWTTASTTIENLTTTRQEHCSGHRTAPVQQQRGSQEVEVCKTTTKKLQHYNNNMIKQQQ